jgi:tetratricopeptide (TPR) repeat protein
METLYDLLGALPEDGADDLRAAFRKAARSSHPDFNPGDPHAELRFRKIIRANEILSDREQRAHYDYLLGVADAEKKEDSKRDVATTIHRLATGAMAAAAVSIVLLGCYIVFGYVDNIPLVTAQAIDAPAAEPVKTAEPVTVGLAEREPAKNEPAKGEPVNSEPVTTSEPVKTIVAALDDTPAITGDRADGKAGIDGDKTPENLIEERVVPGAVVASAVDLPIVHKDQSSLLAHDAGPPAQDQSPAGDQSSMGDQGPMDDQRPMDAGGYREQAISAYRNGDLRLALSKLDLAIALDPNSSEAYVNRSIVLHRLGDTKSAYADITKAKRLDDSNGSRHGAGAGR